MVDWVVDDLMVQVVGDLDAHILHRVGNLLFGLRVVGCGHQLAAERVGLLKAKGVIVFHLDPVVS